MAPAAIAGLIQLIITAGVNLTPRLIALVAELKAMGDNEPTEAQISAMWERIQKAEDRIDAAHAARHAGETPND